MRSIDVIEKTVTKISEILSPISTTPPYQTPSSEPIQTGFMSKWIA